MKNIKATTIGLLVGLLLGGPAAVHAVSNSTPEHDLVGDGFYIDCYGNGDGGKRTCDVHIIEQPGAPVHRMNINQYVNQRWEIGFSAWGYNGGGKDKGNPLNGGTVDNFRVVREH